MTFQQTLSTVNRQLRSTWKNGGAGTRFGMIAAGYVVGVPLLLGTLNGIGAVADAFSPAAAPEAAVAAAPAPEPAPAPAAPAHELAWLAEDPEMAKRMHAECDDLTQVQCETYWEIKRAQAAPSYGRQTYGEFLESRRQRANDLAFCRRNPDDWSCRNGYLSGKY